ncbi:MAG: saccharopine dehydrogenase, partial [Rhizobiales bacterium]|nr:saccharopine dehydrogenase [Hyphomicrobiales bacterium]
MNVSGRIKILIIGGYGAFGSRLVELLKDEPRLKLIIAGRSRSRAKTLCIMPSKAELVPAEFDRDGDVEAQIGWLEPDIVVDASGPFQSYGEDPYRVIRGALAAGADYLDLADSTEFVLGVSKFDDAVRASKKFVLCGLSTCPALSGAVVRALARDLASVERIIGGIAPSPYAGLGYSVVQGVLSYAGKRVGIVRDGHSTTAAGLVDSRDYTITQPGNVPMFTRRFSLIDVPDLKLMEAAWPQAGEVWFSVGTAIGILLKVLNTFAMLVQGRLLPSIRFLAPLVHWVINHVRWGEHRGGMFMRLYGRDAGGRPCRRRWHMIAEGNNGPYVPVMAAAAVIGKCVEGMPPQPGARPASGELELEDFAPLFAMREISTMVLGDVPEDRKRPVYRRVLEHRYG